MISASAKIPIKPPVHPEAQPGWPISASCPAAETLGDQMVLQSELGLWGVCLRTPVLPTALKHRGFPFMAFGSAICENWLLGCSVQVPQSWLLKGARISYLFWVFLLCDLGRDSRSYLAFYYGFHLSLFSNLLFYLPTLYQSTFTPSLILCEFI